MSDRRLQVFHTVAKMLSFTRAAKVLHMTQPAVTFQVQQLEESLNTRLFNRTHHRISLTETGKHVYEYSDRIFALYAQMENRIQDLAGDTFGMVTIGASPTVAEYLLPPLLGHFKGKFPGVEVRLRTANTDEIISMVEYNDIELGMVEAHVINKNLVVEPCRMDRLVAVAAPGHELTRRDPVSADDLVAHPFIARKEGLAIIQDYLQSAGFDIDDLDIVMELDGFEAVKGAVGTGVGVSVLSRTVLARELALGTLVDIQLDPPLEQSFSLVHQKPRFLTRAMDELLVFAHRYCGG